MALCWLRRVLATHCRPPGSWSARELVDHSKGFYRAVASLLDNTSRPTTSATCLDDAHEQNSVLIAIAIVIIYRILVTVPTPICEEYDPDFHRTVLALSDSSLGRAAGHSGVAPL
ncbi:hypothetical protein F5X96DRAFT_673853 [Biscogniauxia mediterranea]|nr:hypothetical protein F5X96DRAFT_673853 [Biscogniauxia mediterranea]